MTWRLTTAQKKQVIRDYLDGRPLAEIVKEYGVARNYARTLAVRWGHPVAPRYTRRVALNTSLEGTKPWNPLPVVRSKHCDTCDVLMPPDEYGPEDTECDVCTGRVGFK